jgi:hypothetical protein
MPCGTRTHELCQDAAGSWACNPDRSFSDGVNLEDTHRHIGL